MDPEKAELDSSCRNGSSSQVVLYGEFTGTPRKVRYALSLSERDLTVQKVPSQNKVVFSLKDCIGCRAHGGDDTADTGAYFSAYFYPLKRRWMMSSGGSRQRVELCYRVSGVPGVSGVQEDPCANLAEAERWALVIRERAARQQHLRKGLMFSELRRPCRVMLLVNPQSGNGQALTLYNSHVQRMLHEAGVPHTLVITERQNHARELAREADLSQWDALVIMSGDGLLFEVINGLLERADWEEAIRTPLGILPGGSGNALAASIHNYSGAAQVFGEELLVSCGFILCKGLVSPMDLASVHLSSSPRVFSFLSLAWGFVADVDVESEKYRHVGSARFTVGTLVRLASLRVYQGRLAYLPAADKEYKEEEEEGGLLDKHTIPNKPLSFCPASLGRQPSQDSPDHTFHNSCNSNNSPYVRRTDDGTPSRNATKALNGPPDSLLSPLDQPVPSDWVVVQEESFVLMLAMYQSHLAEDLMAAPGAVPDEGVIHLFYVREGISRTALLRLFLAMEKGNHLTNNCQHLTYVRARALRLEPHSTKGVITVDGEVVEYGPVQAQIHRGMARLITG